MPSDPLDHATRRAVLRSTKREHAIVLLCSLGEAHPRALARSLGVDIARLHEIMQGKPPRYRVELSPIALGLAVLEATPAGKVYRITNRGRKRARQLTSARVREGAARRGRREAAGRGDAGVPAPGVATPVEPPRDTCSYTWRPT